LLGVVVWTYFYCLHLDIETPLWHPIIHSSLPFCPFLDNPNAHLDTGPRCPPWRAARPVCTMLLWKLGLGSVCLDRRTKWPCVLPRWANCVLTLLNAIIMCDTAWSSFCLNAVTRNHVYNMLCNRKNTI
jgi:hypothetical protein